MAADIPLRPPVEVVRPVPSQELPSETAWPGGPTRYEIKADGWRAVGGVLEEHRPVLFSRQGGPLSDMFPDVLAALGELPVGTVVDGELCAVVNGRMDFAALARRRGRDRRRWPQVVYLVFDLLATTATDLRDRPLQERLDRLGELLPPQPSVLQAVLATTSRSEALAWYEDLRPYAVEGLVAKGLGTSYVPGRTRWVKVRHTDSVDGLIVAAAGPVSRPTRLVVRLPDGTHVETAHLESAQRAAVGRALAGRTGKALAGGWHLVTSPVIAEVAVGSTRHRSVRYVRLRPDLEA